MTAAERAERIAELVEAALEHEPQEWAVFVDAACAGEGELRAEVESLLAYRARAMAFIESPAYEASAESLATDEAGALQPGERIDGYEIVSLLGEGGMGQVYLAQDAELGRMVAIKFVQQGFGRRHLIRQFRQEARILAGLNHPHIARLYGASVSTIGTPYFVMEYVAGERLEEYCQHHRLTIGERLALFRKLCSAVAYAHQHLIIHRDLKPANIRVTPEGEPKLLDFGIASLLDHERQLAEQPRSLAGVMTPGYASPEQIRGETLTTASDVYSLGVILYQLLTGEKPRQLMTRSPEELSRAITEQEPERPSTTVAANPHSAFRNPHFLRGDLDQIVLMAMRPEPERRYASAAEFSEDIGRHLANLPVRARADTWSYRGEKFIRRNKLAVAAAVLVALTLAGGIAATMREARRAHRQRARAERRFHDVRRLADSLIFDLHDAVEHLPGSTAARKLIVSQALKYLDSLAREAGDEPSLQRDLVRGYIRIGNVQGDPSNPNLGDTAGALHSYLQAQQIAEALLAADSHDAETRRSLGVIKEKIGDLRAANGHLTSAIASTRASLDIFRSLAKASPEKASAQRSLAISHIKMGDLLGNPNFLNNNDPSGAMEHYRASLAILTALHRANPENLNTRRFLGLIHERIGAIHEDAGETAAAAESYRESQRIRAELAEENPDNAMLLRDAAIAQEKMANILTAQNALEEALVRRKKSLAIFEQLLAADPRDVQSQVSLAISQIHLADLLGGPDGPNLQRPAEAMQSYRRAIEILRPLAEKNPPDATARRTLSEAREKLEKLGTSF